ncbi:error-prone DNA polymerase [Prosthecomicrobium sp. N25]|uniref:error-prone DNA polymerase n=1 Tax=Prosthecomicrobium sp. N25 TaxID=3129254 RepID=UPI003076AB96
MIAPMPGARDAPPYAELAVATNFSFLRGASHAEEMAVAAATLGLHGFAVADRNTLAGVVRAHMAAKETGARFRVGCRLAFVPPGEPAGEIRRAANEDPADVADLPPAGPDAATFPRLVGGQDGDTSRPADPDGSAFRPSARAGGPPRSRPAPDGTLLRRFASLVPPGPPEPATPDILAWPTNRAAYGRLCRLLTLGNRRAGKGGCRLVLEDLLAWGEGLILAPLAGRVGGADGRRLAETLDRLRAAFGRDNVRLAVGLAYGPGDRRRLAAARAIAEAAGVKLLAVGDVTQHVPERRPLADVLACIREHVDLKSAGRLLSVNAERHMKGGEAMMRLFRDHPAAVAESVAVFDRLGFSLDELRYEYPDEPVGDAATPQEALVRLTWEGAARRYPQGVPDKVRATVEHEFGIIGELGYAPYFLTVHDIVRFAKSRGILAQGRGSAANSAVCFCLGITEVDPDRADLLFERFVSPERREPPDIDVDFEHERREEVIQYIYGKYGRDRAGLAATVISYRARSAVREVGKAFGLSEDAVDTLAGTLWGWGSKPVDETEVRRVGLDPADPTMANVMALSAEIAGFPRHLSQHVGGFVITRGRLDEVVPIQNAAMEDRTVIEWDKDDIDALGILKIDILALGMLTCIRKAFDLVRRHYGRPLTLSAIPAEDPETYRMIQRADTIGVFQIESRAQMTMLPRLKPATFYDLVIEVAIVRPGPIQGDMVHPYLRRRQGLEQVSYPSKELESVLSKTLGVPLFQEQAMKIAIVAAGFTPAEADKLRRAMATFKRVGTIGSFQEKMIRGMAERGYDPAFAERCFRQIEGFGEYGFPESHAASFALLVYASAWLKCHYPDAFAAALLNAQPMGFYAPAQIVRDAREHGVEVRAVDVNLSRWDNTLERGPHAAERLAPRHRSMEDHIWSSHAVRLGFRQIKGLREVDMERLVGARGSGYDSLRDVWLRTGLDRSVLERLADADAFRSIGLDRRDALWAAKGLGGGGAAARLPLFDAPASAAREREPDVALPPMPLGEHVVNDYRFLSLSLKAHPLAFLRERLAGMRVMASERLETVRSGTRLRVAGLVLVRQRPGSAKGVIFMTIEDETGVANIIVWPKVFEAFRPIVLGARLIAVDGRLQSESGVIHVVAEKVHDLTPLLAALSSDAGDLQALANADEVKRPQADMREKIKPASRLQRLVAEIPDLADDLEQLSRKTSRVLPKGRNFQ